MLTLEDIQFRYQIQDRNPKKAFPLGVSFFRIQALHLLRSFLASFNSIPSPKIPDRISLVEAVKAANARAKSAREAEYDEYGFCLEAELEKQLESTEPWSDVEELTEIIVEARRQEGECVFLSGNPSKRKNRWWRVEVGG